MRKEKTGKACADADITYNSHPQTAKSIESHRAHKRSLQQMLAEHVDNSKDAGATKVDITISGGKDGTIDTIVIADNGCGMDSETLYGSFTIGYERKYSSTDVGKYGMGGTSSSLAKADRKETVTYNEESVLGRFYDMAIVRQKNEWVTCPMDASDVDSTWQDSAISREETGTVIKLSRFLKDEKVAATVAAVKRDLGGIFRTALDQGTMTINVNGEPVDAACPVGSHHPKAKKGPREPIILDGVTVGYMTPVSLYDVPNTHLGVGRDGKKVARLERLAGFYFLRGGRLIASHVMTDNTSSWAGGRVRHPLVGHARIKVEFTPEYDALFGLTNDKSSVAPGQALRDVINEMARPFYAFEYKKAKEKKDDRGAKSAVDVLDAATNTANKSTVKPKQKRRRTGESGKGQSATDKVVPIRGVAAAPGWVDKIELGQLGPTSDPWTLRASEKLVVINQDNRFVREYFTNTGKEAQAVVAAIAIAELAAYHQMKHDFEEEGCAALLETFRIALFQKLRACTEG